MKNTLKTARKHLTSLAAGTVLLAGWGAVCACFLGHLLRLRSERRGAAEVLQLGGKEAKACYYENRLAPERVSALIGEEVEQVVRSS